MTDQNWMKRCIIVAIWMIFIFLFSETKPFGMTFDTVFPILTSLPLLYLSYFFLKAPVVEDETEEVTQMREDIAIYEKTLDEQFAVIKEYEDIFDSQLVELPCVCGGNTFKGLFSPNLENIVECEKCHNNYKVSITYDTILISEPMDQKNIVSKLEEI